MNNISKLVRDIKKVFSTVSFFNALKWIFYIFYTLPEILKKKNLEPADIKMGNGPIVSYRNNAHAKLSGHQVFSSIREIWK